MDSLKKHEEYLKTFSILLFLGKVNLMLGAIALSSSVSTIRLCPSFVKIHHSYMSIIRPCPYFVHENVTSMPIIRSCPTPLPIYMVHAVCEYILSWYIMPLSFVYVHCHCLFFTFIASFIYLLFL